MTTGGDDDGRDRRTPRPPSPEELERIRRRRVEPEPLEPVVTEPREADRPDVHDDPPGGTPVEPASG